KTSFLCVLGASAVNLLPANFQSPSRIADDHCSSYPSQNLEPLGPDQESRGVDSRYGCTAFINSCPAREIDFEQFSVWPSSDAGRMDFTKLSFRLLAACLL